MFSSKLSLSENNHSTTCELSTPKNMLDLYFSATPRKQNSLWHWTSLTFVYAVICHIHIQLFTYLLINITKHLWSFVMDHSLTQHPNLACGWKISTQNKKSKLRIYSSSSQCIAVVSWTTKKHGIIHKVENIAHSPVRHNSENVHMM